VAQDGYNIPVRLLALAALLTACSLTTSTDGIFGPGVDASACGAEGVACCTTPSSLCAATLECRRGECVPPVRCGGDGEDCCNGTSCNEGLRCEMSSCSPIPPPPPPDPCGGAGQPCCAATACNAGFVCTAAKCIACGSYQQPCCPGGGCRSATACVDGSCRACCAKCKNRDAYHRVFVDNECLAAAKDYCATGDRGGLGDAKWGTCQAF